MIRALLLAATAIALAQAQPPAAAVTPPHLIAVYADLESPVAARAMVVVRSFLVLHPGSAALEVHLTPPDGHIREVDRAVLAAQAQGAAVAMAELVLANPTRRSAEDFVAMAQQLRLDVAAFRAAWSAATGDPAVAGDLAAAAGLKLRKDGGLVIDGQAVPAPATLADLERRLTTGASPR
jgi:hypothetical protein